MSTPNAADIEHLVERALTYRIESWRNGNDPEPTFGDLVLVGYVGRDTPPEHCLGIYDSCWTYVYPPENGEPLAERSRELVYGVRRLDTGELLTWTDVSLWKVVG